MFLPNRTKSAEAHKIFIAALSLKLLKDIRQNISHTKDLHLLIKPKRRMLLPKKLESQMVAIFEKDKVTEESISSSEVQRGKLSNYKHI